MAAYAQSVSTQRTNEQRVSESQEDINRVAGYWKHGRLTRLKRPKHEPNVQIELYLGRPLKHINVQIADFVVTTPSTGAHPHSS